MFVTFIDFSSHKSTWENYGYRDTRAYILDLASKNFLYNKTSHAWSRKYMKLNLFLCEVVIESSDKSCAVHTERGVITQIGQLFSAESGAHQTR